MAYLSEELRQRVALAARHRCEYCLTRQEISGAQMHIEHIVPLALGGVSEFDNLCLACAWCNTFKAVKTHALDPLTQESIPLFNPRTQTWNEHFRWNESGIEIIGITAIGRATVNALRMNNEYIVPARQYWVLAGWHPPQV